MSCCEKGGACEGTLAAVAISATDAELEAPVPAFEAGTVRVAERLGLASQEVTASRAVSIEGSNAVRVDILVFNLTLDAVSFRVQVSNDAVCWSDAALFRRDVTGYATAKLRRIGFRFVRLFYEASNTAGGKGMLAASLHHWRN